MFFDYTTPDLNLANCSQGSACPLPLQLLTTRTLDLLQRVKTWGVKLEFLFLGKDSHREAYLIYKAADEQRYFLATILCFSKHPIENNSVLWVELHIDRLTLGDEITVHVLISTLPAVLLILCTRYPAFLVKKSAVWSHGCSRRTSADHQ